MHAIGLEMQTGVLHARESSSGNGEFGAKRKGGEKFLGKEGRKKKIGDH